MKLAGEERPDRRRVRLAGALVAATASWLPASVAAGPRPVHGSAGAGGSLLITGDRGDRGRFDVAVDLEPRSRFGAVVAWRAFDGDHRGLIMAGLVFEAAASRPRLVIDLHGDLGADLDARAPLAGGGIRTTFAIAGPLGVALDAGGYLVVDGFDATRLQLQSTVLAVARW